MMKYLKFKSWITNRPIIAVVDHGNKINMVLALKINHHWFAKRRSKTIKILPDGKLNGPAYVKEWFWVYGPRLFGRDA